jgi:phosphatidate cytidylyltransferase
MNNHLIRVALFVLGLPVIFCIIAFDPGGIHLPFNIMAFALIGVGAAEMARIFIRRGIQVHAGLSVLLSLATALLVYLEALGITPRWGLPAGTILILSVLFSYRIFSRDERQVSSILPKLTAYVFILTYPCLFASHITRLSLLPEATIVLSTFILAVYGNDGAAWAMGMLLGGKNRNIIAISPKKSLVGFVSGFLASNIVLCSARAIFPSAFPAAWPAVAGLGCLVGLLAIAGDLVESAFKRSAEVKDSGDVIPGRGGVLDSIDSVIFAVPPFYYAYSLFMGYL